MLPNKTYLNQITMIESECEPRKTPNIPAAIFHRSPIRDRQNKNVINTNTPNRNPKKISISPYRRRQSNTIINPSGSSKVILSKRKVTEPQCERHVGKNAKFMIEGEGQIMYYCQKCAIQLASQGFKVERMVIREQCEYNPRKKQLDEFVANIQNLLAQLEKKKQAMDKVIAKGEKSLKQQVEKVEQYYGQFYEIIDEHKSRVLEELSQQYEAESKAVKLEMSGVNEAIEQSEKMKNEITNLQQQILKTEERQYRPCMNQYIEKINEYHGITQAKTNQLKLKKLSFNDPDEACQAFIKCMNIEWQEQEKQQKQYPSQQSTNRNENPIEYLEKQQKQQNSNIKTLSNLFSSFDQ